MHVHKVIVLIPVPSGGNVGTDETVAWLVVKGSNGEAVVKDCNVEATTAHAV